VHIGQDDLPPASVRAIAGEQATVGLSTHTIEQLERAVNEPVSYVAIGPVFGTTTKVTGHERVGLEMVREAALRTRARGLPLVAIGGITLESAPSVLAAGASSVAVIGDLLATGDPMKRAQEFLSRLADSRRLAERNDESAADTRTDSCDPLWPSRDLGSSTARPPGRRAFELPRRRPEPIGTTAWRVIDRVPARDVHRIHRVPERGSAGLVSRGRTRRGDPAPYLREGLPEVRTFASLLRSPETVFDGLEGVRTHADLDAAPPRRRGSCRSSSFHTAIPASRARTPRCTRTSPATATSCSASSTRTKRQPPPSPTGVW
jgi:hypothetical protein